MKRLGRFDISPLFRGHWKGLTNGVDELRPDWVGRVTLTVGPAVILFFRGYADGRYQRLPHFSQGCHFWPALY